MSINETLNNLAKEQAGVQNENNLEFEITDFNYNVDVVANLLKKHIEDTNYVGVSVYYARHNRLCKIFKLL